MGWDDARVSIEQWWPKLTPAAREWLIAHNGEPLTPQILAAVSDSGDAADPSDWWWDSASGELAFSDAGVDWIEAVANGEDSGTV
jgi:hypothetical protein